MVFCQLSKGFRKDKTAVFLGAPEAEALPNSQMPLSKVYKDHCHLVDSLAHEKFIVVGRKGSGKSAFAEHICSVSENQSNRQNKWSQSRAPCITRTTSIPSCTVRYRIKYLPTAK